MTPRAQVDRGYRPRAVVPRPETLDDPCLGPTPRATALCVLRATVVLSVVFATFVVGPSLPDWSGHEGSGVEWNGTGHVLLSVSLPLVGRVPTCRVLPLTRHTGTKEDQGARSQWVWCTTTRWPVEGRRGTRVVLVD